MTTELVDPSDASESVAARPDAVDAAPWWQRALTAAPDAILLPLLWLCLTVSATIIFRVFSPWLVIPVVVVASALTWRWRPRSYSGRFAWQSSLAALIGAVVWLVVNARFASQWLIVTRDPGFLTLEGVWLSKHTSPNLPAADAAALAAKIPGATVSGSAYFYSDGVLHVQGAKLVPGLVAIGGWFGGIHGVLVANLVIGAIALLLFYGLGRRMVGPIWSLAATASLAISMPFIGFTRTVYSEPVVVAVTFGGFTMLWLAYRARNRVQFALGGALIGAGGLARVDGAAITVGLVVGLALAAAGTTSTVRRRELRSAFLLAGGAAIVVTALGLYELHLDSPEYLAALRAQWHDLVKAVSAVFVLGVLVLLGPPWRWITVFLARHARVVGGVVLALVIVVGAALASRPLWYEGHHIVAGSAYSSSIKNMAQAQGLTVGPTQSFDENSLTWIAMYYSWVVVAAAVLGLGLALRHALVHREPALLFIATVIAAPSLLYLWNVSITPDQLWAMRRFLPMTLPGFVLLAAWFFHRAVLWLLARTRPVATVTAVATCLVAAGGFAFPAVSWTSSNLFTAVEYGGQLSQLNAMCKLADGRPVIVVGGFPTTVIPAIQTVCGDQVIALDKRLTTDELKNIAAVYGSSQPLLFISDPIGVPWAGGTAPAPYTSAQIQRWPSVLNERPTQPFFKQTTWRAGTIDADGKVVGIPAP
ncbi:hypothetical protein GCM10022288_13480 [Gryllotalpicola kribbensis]|uniref:Glycosyltransferase RgtA/B/C/D-like domain-containing protein n=1 Tax=Gryllotalpicola kribbensis TaxID=993084 RepID=A0ABP8AQT1_9MICO